MVCRPSGMKFGQSPHIATRSTCRAREPCSAYLFFRSRTVSSTRYAIHLKVKWAPRRVPVFQVSHCLKHTLSMAPEFLRIVPGTCRCMQSHQKQVLKSVTTILCDHVRSRCSSLSQRYCMTAHAIFPRYIDGSSPFIKRKMTLKQPTNYAV